MSIQTPLSEDTVDGDLRSTAFAAIATWLENTKMEFTASECSVAEVIGKCNLVGETGCGKMKSRPTPQKQTTKYNTRQRKDKSSATVCYRVCKKNARRKARRRGRLLPVYSGPFTDETITFSGQVTLRGEVGLQLETLYKAGLLKPCIVQIVDITTVKGSVKMQQAVEALLPSTSTNVAAISNTYSGSNQLITDGQQCLFFSLSSVQDQE